MISNHRGLVFGIAVIILIATFGGFGSGIALADNGPVSGDEHAQLSIEQPLFVEDAVDIERTSNRTIYQVSGPEQRIILEGEEFENIVDFGILEGTGEFTADSQRQQFHLDATGEAGTRVIFFDVERSFETEQTVERDNETVTEIVSETDEIRYVATIEIDRVQWDHLEGEQFVDLRTDADNWSEVSAEADRLSDDPVEETISRSFTLYRFWDSPAATFLADAQAAVIILTSRPGGIAILGVLLGTMLAGSYGALKTAARYEREFEEVEDLDESRREVALQNARQVLSEADWGAMFPEHHARALRDLLGDDVWLGFKRYMLLRSPRSVKGTILQAMGVVGYTALVKRNEERVPVEVVITEPKGRDSDLGEAWESFDLDAIDYEKQEHRDIIDLIPGSSLDLDVFTNADIALTDVRFPITNRDVDEKDLIDELDPRFPGDFEDEKQLAEALERMIEFVVSHDHTDSIGRSRREMDLLAFMNELDQLLCDRADFPVWHVERRILLFIAENIDPGEGLQDRIDELAEDGIDRGTGS